MSLFFPPTPAWRRTRPAAAAARPDDDSSTIQSDAALPGRPARSSSGSLWRRVTDWLAGYP
jgi:hypothetical protein